MGIRKYTFGYEMRKGKIEPVPAEAERLFKVKPAPRPAGRAEKNKISEEKSQTLWN